MAGDGPIPRVTLSGGSGSSTVDAKKVNKVAKTAEKRQQQVAAENAALRLVYGRAQIGAQIADVLLYNGQLVIFVVWGQGPWNAIEQVYLDDAVPAASVIVTNHLGTQVSPDPTLILAYAQQSPSIAYSDILPGIVYSVIRMPASVTTGFPRITATVQGLKVYDPRTALTAYSDNPALAIADLQTNATYGAGGQVDWARVTTTANACDALVAATEKRRTLGLAIDNVQPLNDWLEAMRAYAGCFLARNGALLTLIPDRPASSTFTFSEPAGTARISQVKRRSKRDTPTVVAVRYTDTSALPWRDGLAYAYAAGVLAGTTPWKIRELALPGIQRFSQASREATEQLNKLFASDITFQIEGQDEALAVTIGDVITAIANVAFGGVTLARVIGASSRGPGRPVFDCEIYSAAVYSDTVLTVIPPVDTTLPDPNNPPAPVSLVLTEELYQVNAGGTYESRIKATWAAPSTFPASFVRDYRIEVSLAGAIIDSATPAVGEYRTPHVQENATFNVNVWLRSATGVWSPSPVSGSILVTGTPPPPADVSNFVVRSTAGRLYTTWSLNSERNVVDYEIRYALTNSWAAGTLLARVPAAEYVTDTVPAGTWYVMIKARTNVRTAASPDGGYSTNAASVQVAVDLNTQNLVRANYLFLSPTLSNMATYKLPGDATIYDITDFGDGVGFGADFPVNTVGTFGDSLVNRVFAAPHTSGTSEWLSDVFDLGSAIFGDWNWTGNVVALDGGAYVPTLQLKTLIGDPWTDYTVFPARVSARYARLKIDALLLNTMLVKRDAVGPGVTLDAAYKTEPFTVTTSATLATTVPLLGKYSLKRAIAMSPSASAARGAVYANVTLSPTGANTFDIRAFDDAGNQVALEVSGLFQGV